MSGKGTDSGKQEGLPEFWGCVLGPSEDWLWRGHYLGLLLVRLVGRRFVCSILLNNGVVG